MNRTSRSRTVRGLAMAAVVALGITACTSSGNKPNGSSSSGSGATPLVVEDKPVPSFTNDFNPFDNNSAANQENTQALVYEPLFVFNTLDSSKAPIPWLATDYSWSNGNKTLTLKLRQNVKWTDGQAFSSADVKFTFDLMQKFPAANIAGAPTAAGITTPDANTVQLTYATPQAANFANIANQLIVPQHLWASISNPATAVISGKDAVGTGPYVVNTFSTQNITYKANASYWNGAPKVKAVSLPAYADNNAATLALASGQIDLAGNDINSVQSTFVAKNPSQNHLWQSSAPYFPSANTVVLLLNNKSTTAPALGDAKVRKAISAALNRQQLASQCETNYELPATSSGGLTLPVDQGSLSSSVSNDLKPASDEATATSLLQGDGWTKSGGKWTKNGQTIKFTIIDPNSFTDYWCGAQAIAQGLNAQGFDVSTNGAFDFNTWNTAITTGKFDAAIHWGQGGTPFQRLQFITDPSQTAPVGQTAAQNFDRYDTKAVTDAISAYENATAPSDQQNALNTIQGLVSSDAPAVPILYGAAWYEYTTANFSGWPNSANPYVNPSPNAQNYLYLILHLKPNS